MGPLAFGCWVRTLWARRECWRAEIYTNPNQSWALNKSLDSQWHCFFPVRQVDNAHTPHLLRDTAGKKDLTNVTSRWTSAKHHLELGLFIGRWYDIQEQILLITLLSVFQHVADDSDESATGNNIQWGSEDTLVKILTKVWSSLRPIARSIPHPETAEWEASTTSRLVTMRPEAMEQLSLSITLNKELSDFKKTRGRGGGKRHYEPLFVTFSDTLFWQ